MEPMNVAVVTAYCRESDPQLERCIDSVRAQRHPRVTHYLVADGHPRPALAGDPSLRHLALPVAHRDYGNTPRGLGGICALNEGADVICYLDADNAYLPDHVESVVEALSDGVTGAAFAHRLMHVPEEPSLWVTEPEDEARRHVDTSCIAIHRRAAHLLPLWAMMPPTLSVVGDRVFLHLLHRRGVAARWTGRHTVLYESRWASTYRRLGLPVPPGAQSVPSGALADYDPADALARLGEALQVA